MSSVTGDSGRATSATHAADLMQASLLQLLSALGREHLDIVFWSYRRALEQFQIDGALEALEMAKQEGHVAYLGLACEGPALATLGMWQFHDAFDLVLANRSQEDHEAFDTLLPMARERRVGMVARLSVVFDTDLPKADSGLPSDQPTDQFAFSSQDGPVVVSVSTPHAAALLASSYGKVQ